jgi:hypothetical protein
MARPPATPDRTRTYNLCNFNMARDALERASRLASVYDMVDNDAERNALREALDAEMTLARSMMDMVEYLKRKKP